VGKKCSFFRILLVFCSFSYCSLRLFTVLFLCFNLLLSGDSVGPELGLGKEKSFFPFAPALVVAVTDEFLSLRSAPSPIL
jgi:hypothetical protein